jgi:predicted nucleic acid-binding protein
VPTFALDTSCMVAAVCTWHERHADTVAGIEDRLDRGEQLAIAAHALLETYAVLTGLPSPHRLSPADAWALVRANFVESAAVVALTGSANISLLTRLAATGTGGGRSYDAVIAVCAAMAQVDALLTLNPRHFDPPPEGVAVIEPAAPPSGSAHDGVRS